MRFPERRREDRVLNGRPGQNPCKDPDGLFRRFSGWETGVRQPGVAMTIAGNK